MKDHWGIVDSIRREREQDVSLTMADEKNDKIDAALCELRGWGDEVAVKDLLVKLRTQLASLEPGDLKNCKDILEVEESAALDVVKRVVERLARGLVGDLRQADLKELEKAKVVLEGCVRRLKCDVEKPEESRSKRNSGEWVIVGEEEDDLSEKFKILKREIEGINATLTSLLPILSSLARQPTFNLPVQITSHLGGNPFPFFPSEYSLAELITIIKVRFATGPGSKHIQNGQFELMDAADRGRLLTIQDAMRPGGSLILAIVVNELVGEGQKCPVPSCKGATTSRIEEGGRICNQCGVWFHHSELPKPSASSPSPKQSGKSRPTQKLPNIPYRLNDRVVSADDDISAFKYIKIYPLTNLAFAGENGKWYQCKNCDTHLALHDDIISRNFRGRHGKACLLSKIHNITRGPTEERIMTTGKHDICDVYCKKCREYVGWGYETAEFESEAYKVGKFLLEKEMVDVRESEDKTGNMEAERVMSGNSQRNLELLSRVTTRRGELLGLEYLEERLRALMDEENEIINSRGVEEE